MDRITNINGSHFPDSDLSAEALVEKVQHLENEIKTFGQKRAYFMDIYKKKEEETIKLQDEVNRLKHMNSRLESDLKGIREQVADMKTEHMIVCLSRDEQMERVKLQHQQEISSLNLSLQDLLTENTKIENLKHENQCLKDELKSVRLSLQGKIEKEQNLLKLSLKTGSCTSDRCSKEKQDLKLQLDISHQKLQKYADLQTQENVSVKKQKDLFEVADLQDKVSELEKELTLEVSSRRDLEMFVSVMSKQRDLSQTEIHSVRQQLAEALSLVEKERKEHNNLKLTWQMANDQFLEAQRLLMIDMRRLESVLTEEQQRNVADLQKQDEEREIQQRRISELQNQRQEHMNKIDNAETLLDVQAPLKPSSSHSSLNSADTFGEFERAEPVSHSFINSYSPSPSGSMERDTISPQYVPSIKINNDLTDAINSALAAPHPEDIENKKVLDLLRSQTPDRTLAAGNRVVSEEQWEQLQKLLSKSRATLGRPCDMCQNYEIELQNEQEKIKSLESQLSQSRQNVKTQKKLTQELELKMKEVGEQNKAQLTELSNHIQLADEETYLLKCQLNELAESSSAQLALLRKQREETQKQLEKLELENQQLLDMHSQTSEELLAEKFTQPSNLEAALALLNECREKLIDTKAAKQHIEQKYKSQLQIANDQAIASEIEMKSAETMYIKENNDLKLKVASLESMETEMLRESSLRQEMEEEIKKTEKKIESFRKTEQQLTTQIQTLVNDNKQLKEREEQVRSQLKTLQHELTTSESVQKDFVKLSQQLQIQLEKIRQSETEIRWQYDDDVTECYKCAVRLSHKMEKYHCMHCGKIHCQECTSKIIQAGPKKRPTRVCDICHTILVHDAKPYFSMDSNLDA